MDKKTICEVMRYLGSKTSEAKAEAARRNGKRGGRGYIGGRPPKSKAKSKSMSKGHK